MMVLVLEDDFWIHSRNCSLVTTVNHFVNDCPNLHFHNFHSWECSREHSPGCTRTFGCGGCPSMQQSGLSLPFVFECLLYDLLWFLFHCRFAFELNMAWGERSFVCASRFPEACVSERQISRVLWTIRNSRFPTFADQNHIRSSYFFLPRFSLESISYSPGFLFTWRIFVSQIRCAARRDNMCLLSPSEKIKWRDFLKMLWLLQSSHRVLYFLSEEFHSTIYELYGSIWWR